MLTFKVKVMMVNDETKELPIKDKFGIPTQQMKKYRFVNIQGMYKDPDTKVDRYVVVKSVDPTFPIPAVGSDFTTPEVRKYEVEDGIPKITC